MDYLEKKDILFKWEGRSVVLEHQEAVQRSDAAERLTVCRDLVEAVKMRKE